MDFTEKTERFIRESGMLRQKGSVTVGISGGADSVCLFLQLSELREKLGIELKAVTVEHGIRGHESESDAEFSKKLCESHVSTVRSCTSMLRAGREKKAYP